MIEDKDISLNFTIAKVMSILMVSTGHYFSNNTLIPFWAPVCCGLFIFGFASGYFTSKKYYDNFNLKEFWKKKFDRLFYKILLISLFLLLIFLFQQKENIWTMQTLLTIIGLSGFMEWFNISMVTPYGNGLWFFTLLLLFYLTYPVLKIWIGNTFFAVILLFILFELSVILHHYFYMGHALWLTILSFYFGVFIANHKDLLTMKNIMIFFVFSTLLFFVLQHYLKYNEIKYFCVQAISIGIVLYLTNYRLNKKIFSIFTVLSGALLEIYFIHTYLFLHFERIHVFLSYILSLTLIVFVSLFLSRLANFLGSGQKSTAFFEIR
jgi:hypothetical protein